MAFSASHGIYLGGETDLGRQRCIRQQHGRAMRSLLEHLGAAPADDNVVRRTSVTCLLFICFETLQGNDPTTFAHLEASLEIFSNIDCNSSKLRRSLRAQNVPLYRRWRRSSSTSMIKPPRLLGLGLFKLPRTLESAAPLVLLRFAAARLCRQAALPRLLRSHKPVTPST